MEQSKNGKVTDLSYLKKLSNSDDNFVREMIATFIEETPLAIDNLEKHMANKDWKRVSAIAHKIKPSLMFIGLNDLQEPANFIEENAGEETNLDQLPELIAKVKKRCDEAVKELQEEIKAFKTQNT
jgi:HPt (histidine-containing phosphotransfer) domain-containing protein